MEVILLAAVTIIVIALPAYYAGKIAGQRWAGVRIKELKYLLDKSMKQTDEASRLLTTSMEQTDRLLTNWKVF